MAEQQEKRDMTLPFIFIAGGLGVATSIYATLDTDVTNAEALLVEALFGITLALYILRLQRKDSTKLEEDIEDRLTGGPLPGTCRHLPSGQSHPILLGFSIHGWRLGLLANPLIGVFENLVQAGS